MFQVKAEDNKRLLEDDEGMILIENKSGKRMRTRDRFELVLLLKNSDAGQVIGKGGVKIKAIRAASGAFVNIVSLIPNTDERIVEVQGDVEDVAEAIKLIASALSEDKPYITILAERRNLGAVIGKGGEKINQIRDETRASIDIEKECIGNSSQKEIIIRGEPEAVSQAIETIVMLLSEGKNPVRMAYVPLPASMAAQADYNMMPSRYRGGRQRRWSERPDNSMQGPVRIETVIWVPRSKLGKIIGKGGSHINMVRKRSGATIILSEVSNEDRRKLSITGSRSSQNLACEMFESLARR
jgi:predicted RNA-binding protein YlqC (UPF0109 family)